jgi:hypothetical protein
MRISSHATVMSYAIERVRQGADGIPIEPLIVGKLHIERHQRHGSPLSPTASAPDNAR